MQANDTDALYKVVIVVIMCEHFIYVFSLMLWGK